MAYTEAERLADHQETERLQQRDLLKAQAAAAQGWLQNIIDTYGESNAHGWADDMTLDQALAGAKDYALSEWSNYQDAS